MHSLLKRQVKKHFGDSLPESPGFMDFLEAIETAYKDADRRNKTLENIVTVTTSEAESEVESIKNAINEASLVAVINKRGSITALNKSLQKLTGLFPENFLNKSIFEIIDQGQEALIAEAISKLSGGNSWQGEIKFTTDTKRQLWLSGTATPLRDAYGNTTRILVLLHDITSRKLYEEEIINSEIKYKSVLNNIREVVFQADNSGEWTFLNAAWKEITGFEISDTLGNKVSNYIHHEDFQSFSALFSKVLGNEIYQHSTLVRIQNNFNNFNWIQITLRPTLSANGDVTGVSGTMHDITENNRNLELLAESYSFQKAILDSARQGIISTDLSGMIKTFNGGACHLFSISDNQAIGSIHIAQLIKSKLLLPAGDLFNTNNNNNKKDYFNEEIECHINTAECLLQDALLSISEIKDKDDKVTGYLFIVSDNSKRKKAESEVYKLNTIIEESPDYVSYYDMNDKLLYANKAYKALRDIHDLKNEPVLYPKWAELIIKRKAIPYAIEHGSWKGETAIFDHNKKEIPVLQLIIIHKDEQGLPVFRSSISRDITHRKSYEHKLLQSEKRNRDLVNYSQAIICTHDMQGRLMSINPSGCTLLEYEMDEMIGKSISEFMPYDYRSVFNEQYLKSFEKNKVAEGVLYLLSKSGKPVSLLYKNYKVVEPGETSYVIGFAQDISERLIAETELKAAKLAAEESVKTKELFLANMSHEIRTPMNGIVGLTNLLIKTTLTDKQKEYAFSVKHNAENLLVVINDILDFSKIQAGKLDILKKPFDLGSLLYNIRQTFKEDALRKKIELITLLDDKLPKTFLGDVIRINQVLVNLISNAIKFTDVGMVSLTSTLVTQREEACRIKFIVEDTGIGIQREKLDKIFNSFTQANAETSRKYGGTGLGLTIIKNLLDLMGSQIKVESHPGKGSSFSFELNLEIYNGAIINEHENDDENHEGKLNGKRILLAEDNKVNQLFVSELLNEWGAHLDIADNGKIAIEMLIKNQYDLILMDIQMPEMSGLEATEHIRKEFAIPMKDIPIIAMTANAMKGDENKFRNSGFNDVIFKPFHANEFFLIINNHLKTQLNDSVNVKHHSADTTGDHTSSELRLQYANLAILKAFSRGKNKFILKMIQVLLETVPPTIEELDKAISTNDWVSVGKYSHKLIPNMNMMGNAQLEKEMKWMEDNATNILLQNQISNKWSSIKNEVFLTINDLAKADKYYHSRETNADS